MASSPLTVDSRTSAMVRPRPRFLALRANLAGRRRTLQVALGLIWLLDAALQFQPYMFTRAFPSQVIQGSAAGNPALIANPITWSAGLMARHIAVCNALFATIQLLLALGLLYRPTARVALAASIPWAIGVWWIGEGLGGLLAGTANPVTGAPGAAILYVFLALLAWPGEAAGPRGSSVATTGWLGSVAPRIAWAGLWGSFALSAAQPANREPGALAATLSGMRAGEPGWIGAVDSALARAVAHLGPEVSVVLAVLCAVAAATVALERFTRLGVLVAVVLGAVIWLAEDLGGILTGQGTDPNTGLLLIVIAAAFWPLAAGRVRRPGPPISPSAPVAGHRSPDCCSARSARPVPRPLRARPCWSRSTTSRKAELSPRLARLPRGRRRPG